MTGLNRRRVLQLGATGAAAALGGCLGGGGSDDPGVTDWLPATDDGPVAAYFDFTITEKTSKIDPMLPLVLPSNDDAQSFTPNLSGLDDLSDPLLRFPLRTGGLFVGFASLSLAAVGLASLVDPRDPVADAELFVADGATVLAGDIDPVAAEDALTSGTESPFDQLELEATGDTDGFALYEPVSDESGTVAVSDAAVVAADARTEVETVVATYRGDHDRAVDTDDTFRWLFETAGVGDIAVGWRGPTDVSGFSWGAEETGPDTDLVSSRDDVLASVAFEPNSGEITADLALRSDSLDDAKADRAKSALGVSARESSVSVDGDRLTASATYASDVLDVKFVEPAETTEPTTPPGGDDLPEPVADAVPEGAFGFSYNEEEGAVRVTFTEEFEADEVTAKALESGFSTSTTTPGPVQYVNVYVEPGDEVVVTVTVDGVTGTVATFDVPADE